MHQHNDNDDFDELEDWLDGQDGSGAPLWNPEPGDTLTGTFLRYEERYSQKIGAECKVAIIDERHTRELYAVWLTRSVLAREYERQDPQPGDGMGHKYHGLKEGRNGGKPYHSYTVRRMPGSGRPPSAPSVVPPPTPTPTPTPATAAATPGPRQIDDNDIPF